MEAWENLAHQVTLLGLDPESGRVRRKADLALAAAGGALAELAFQERVSLVGKKVVVHDERPTQDPLLDVLLQVLMGQPDRRPTRIINAARKTYLEQALAELVVNGWVRLEPAHGLHGNRYYVLDEQRLAHIRTLAAAGLVDPVGVPSRVAFLAGMACELALIKELAPGLKLSQRIRTAKALRERDWVVNAVNDIITARQAATVAAL